MSSFQVRRLPTMRRTTASKRSPSSIGFFLVARLLYRNDLFIEVAEKMERFDTHIGSLESALQKRPEVFESVGVNLAINVLLGMINNLVRIIRDGRPIIGHAAHRCRARFPPRRAFESRLWSSILAASRNDASANFAVPFEDADNRSLVLPASAGDAALVRFRRACCEPCRR